MTYLLRSMPIGLIFSVAASAVGVYRPDQPAEKEGRRAASSGTQPRLPASALLTLCCSFRKDEQDCFLAHPFP